MTLLDDLEAAADHFEAVSRSMPPLNPMNRDTAARAARLRAHAANLRRELKARKTVAIRINGGPLPEPTEDR